jgi:transcriptional regulator with XRE-family HTH domain
MLLAMNDEVKRLLSVLRTAMKILDVTNREVEKKLGQSYGYLSRLFAGTIDLKVEHILDICQAIGLRPAEFFHLAYPRAGTPTESARRLREVLQGFQQTGLEHPEPEPEPQQVTPAEMEKMMLDSLHRLLKQMAAGTPREP